MSCRMEEAACPLRKVFHYTRKLHFQRTRRRWTAELGLFHRQRPVYRLIKKKKSE